MCAASCKKVFATASTPFQPPAYSCPSSSREPGAHRVSGRAAVTSHRGSGFHGPEGARKAGMPGGSATAYRRCSAPEADGAPYVPRRKWRCGTCARPNAATDTGRAGVGSVRSFYEFVRASIARPSSHLPAKARCESRRGNEEVRLSSPPRKWGRGGSVRRTETERGTEGAADGVAARERKENAGGAHISARQSHITTQV